MKQANINKVDKINLKKKVLFLLKSTTKNNLRRIYHLKFPDQITKWQDFQLTNEKQIQTIIKRAL